MKKTLLVTDLNFWKADIGSRQRILRFYKYIFDYVEASILYIGRFENNDLEKLSNFNIISLYDIEVDEKDINDTKSTKTKNLDNFYSKEIKSRFDKYLKANDYKNIIIEYITLDYLVNDIHNQYCTIIDTHDLMSSRTNSYKKYDNKPSIIIDNLDDEVKILEKYKFILVIQKNEYNILAEKIDENKIKLVQHAVDINKNPNIKQKVKKIVFVSGPANTQHIVWFIENVWTYFQDNKIVSLDIYGTVCSKLKNMRNYKKLNLKGKVESLDDIYKDADIVINPILYGSGLKIKNVEALSYGLPLITTDEGSNGIEDGIGKAYLLANEKDEWIDSILWLIISKKKRESLSKNAIKYADKNFNNKNCYQKVIDILK